MLWSELRYAVRATIDELSSRGTILPTTKVADLQMKLKYYINPLLFELASTTGKLGATKNYTLNPVDNALAGDTSSIKKFIGTDFTVELVGARAYYFQANGPASVYIEEYVSGAWVALPTPLVVTIASTVTELTEYKGLITALNTANKIRLRFSGTSPYDYRNYKLYTYVWATAAEVQEHRPEFKFTLPTDYLKLNSMNIRKDVRQFVAFTPDKWEEPSSFWVNRYLGPCEIQLKYWRKPTLLTWTEPADIADASVIDATADAVNILALGLAARAMIAEKDETSGMVLQNLWEAAKAQLPGNDGTYSGTVVSTTEW